MDIKNNITFFQTEASNHGARLIVVSKTQPIEKLQEAYQAGQRIFGENKVQEMTAKHDVLPPDIEWHMIGHLQTNKVKFIAPFVSLIHSVDSIKLLNEIDRQAKKNARIIPCLLQIHIAREETKFGWDAAELLEAFDQRVFDEFDSVKITGLMGMASLIQDRDHIQAEFRGLKNLFDSLGNRTTPGNIALKELSMGMSSDYAIALQEGSTLIRIGSAIFGERSVLQQN